MKKIFLSIILSFNCLIATAQYSITDLFIEDVLFNNYFDGTDIYFSLQHLNNANTISNTLDYSKFYGVGFGINKNFYCNENLSIYPSFEFVVGWHNTTNDIKLDLSATCNIGYCFYSNMEKKTALESHIGIGIRDNMLFINDNSSYYSEDYYQTSGIIPIGIKMIYKRIYIDFTYKIDFLKSEVSSFESINYNNWYYKQKREFSSNITTFPYSLSFGIIF